MVPLSITHGITVFGQRCSGKGRIRRSYQQLLPEVWIISTSPATGIRAVCPTSQEATIRKFGLVADELLATRASEKNVRAWRKRQACSNLCDIYALSLK